MFCKVRPQDVGEIKLRIGNLPKQEITDPMLAARAYYQVYIW